MVERLGRERLLWRLLAGTPDRTLDAITAPVPEDAADLTALRLELVELASSAPPVTPSAALRQRLLAGNPRPRRPRRPVLVVLDMINDHLSPGRPLEISRARDIVPALAHRLATASAQGIPVIYACDSHSIDDPDYDAWPLHALEGSDGAAVWPALAPEPGDRVVTKPTSAPSPAPSWGPSSRGSGPTRSSSRAAPPSWASAPPRSTRSSEGTWSPCRPTARRGSLRSSSR
jgi:hypothetical protein